MTQVKPAPEDAVLGKYAFADERDDVPEEPDNVLEKELWQTLRSHFDNGASVPKKLADKISQILRDGVYTDYFRPYKDGVLYRGMAVDENYLRRALGLIAQDDIPPKGKKQSSYVFKPFNGIYMSSWSKGNHIANKFATMSKQAYLGNYKVIMSAHASENEFCWIALGEKEFEDEEELPAIGHVKVFEIQWKRVSENSWQNFSID